MLYLFVAPVSMIVPILYLYCTSCRRASKRLVGYLLSVDCRGMTLLLFPPLDQRELLLLLHSLLSRCNAFDNPPFPSFRRRSVFVRAELGGSPSFKGNCERERKDKLKELQEAGSGALSIFAYLR